jgi:hypothetical protein
VALHEATDTLHWAMCLVPVSSRRHGRRNRRQFCYILLHRGSRIKLSTRLFYRFILNPVNTPLPDPFERGCLRLIGCIHICRSPNWNEPHIGMGTPRFGILTYPYPYRYGESPYQYGDCTFFAFFSHAQDRPFLTKQTTTQQKLQYPHF